MSILAPHRPEPDHPEVELPSHEQEELDALIREARRRARRRRAGYASAFGLSGLIAAAVLLSAHGGGTSSRGASGAGGAAGKTSSGAQPRFDPQSVSFVSPSRGWVWGPGVRWLTHGDGPGVLARTDDGGRHWTVIPTPRIDYQPPSAYPASWASGVRFVDEHQGYLFGGELYSTADGGHHWAQIRPPGHIFDVEVGRGRAYAVIRSCRGFVAACPGDALYRLENGGRRFIRTGPTSPFGSARLAVHGPSVYLLAAPPAYRVTTPIALWASANGGQSWQHWSTPCHGEVEWDALAAWSGRGLALACGSEPGAGSQQKTLFVSQDAGAHWRLAGRVPGSPGLGGLSYGYVASLAAVNKNTWALGEGRGTVRTTHDSGRTWRPAAFTGRLGPVEGWGYVHFTDARHGIAVPWTLNGSVLAFTNNAGRDWSEVAFPSPRSR